MSKVFRSYPPITVGIINYNGSGVIANTINSALKGDYPARIDVVVVDDCSTDSSPEIVRKDFPQAKLFIQEKNMGPNAARNRVLAEAQTEIVFVTDNDIELAPDCLRILADRLLAEPAAAVATPMVLDYHLRDQVYSNGAGLHYVCFGIIELRHQKAPADQALAPFPSVCGSGGIMMVNRARALALGGFDEDFIFGYDDGEFTYRVSASGLLVEQVPSARIYHLEKPGRNPKRLRYQIRGRWTLILKAYSARSLILLFPALALFELAQVAFLAAKGQAGEWFSGIGMVLSGMGSIMAKRRKVMESKTRPDNQLLTAGEIYMFPSRVGGRWMRLLKGAMESGLGIYWKLVSPLLTK